MDDFWSHPERFIKAIEGIKAAEKSIAEKHWTRALKANKGYLANETDPQLIEKFSRNAMEAYARLLVYQVTK